MMKPALFLLVFLLPSGAYADGPVNNVPLQQTQQMLNDPVLRQKALSSDPRAKAMDSAARQVVGDQNTGDVYELASELMGTLSEQNGGDPVKMMEMLQQLQKNPQAIEKMLTPEQRAKIKAISERMPAAAPASQGQQTQLK
jgi:hypothetical protein